MYKEMGMKFHITDITELVEWLEANNLFCVADICMCSLSSGIPADETDSINCLLVRSTNAGIMLQIDGFAYCNVSLKKGDK